MVLERAAFEPGRPISFSIRVQNASTLPVTLTFPTTQWFDVIIESEAIEIDRWSDNQTCKRPSRVCPRPVRVHRAQRQQKMVGGEPLKAHPLCYVFRPTRFEAEPIGLRFAYRERR